MYKQQQYNIVHYHFIGIGGIGMSGLAKIAAKHGHKVTGSDIKENLNLGENITIYLGHRAENICNPDAVIYSTDVTKKGPNAELEEAKKREIKILHRSEFLREITECGYTIGIAGSHGKTTTTALVGHILMSAKKDPTVINGGLVNNIGSNAHIGENELNVIETDESDGSFLNLKIDIGVVTNIDYEHVDYYKNFDDCINTFRTFIKKIYDKAVLCIDNSYLKEIVETKIIKNYISYGFDQSADIHGFDIEYKEHGTSFKVLIKEKEQVAEIYLPILGQHNVQNALAAIAVCDYYGVSLEEIKEGLATFKGVQRRFTECGNFDGVTIIDDYAHHPTEVLTVIQSAKQKNAKRIIAVFEPHRYTRMNQFMDDFVNVLKMADIVYVLPLHAAFENPIEGVSGELLAEKLNCSFIDDPRDLAKTLLSKVEPGDYVLCMGAGKITYYARALAEELTELKHAA